MDYVEAMTYANTVKWKVTTCPSGEECWCRMIEPVEKLIDNKDNEIYIAGSGEINKIHAEHIVKIHNDYIDRMHKEKNDNEKEVVKMGDSYNG